MKRLAIAFVLCLSVSGCGGKKNAPPAEEEDEVGCDSNSDCESGWQCLDHECVDTSSKAIYTHPSNAVTPEKVKREVERRQEEHTKRVDESLGL